MGRNVIGQEFGYWTVIKRAKKRNNRAYWLAQCRCGSLMEIRVDNLRNCRRVSCGCRKLQIEQYRREKSLVNMPNNN